MSKQASDIQQQVIDVIKEVTGLTKVKPPQEAKQYVQGLKYIEGFKIQATWKRSQAKAVRIAVEAIVPSGWSVDYGGGAYPTLFVGLPDYSNPKMWGKDPRVSVALKLLDKGEIKLAQEVLTLADKGNVEKALQKVDNMLDGMAELFDNQQEWETFCDRLEERIKEWRTDRYEELAWQSKEGDDAS